MLRCTGCLFAPSALKAYTVSATKIADEEVAALNTFNVEGGLDSGKLWGADDVARRLWSCSIGAYAIAKYDGGVPEGITSRLTIMLGEVQEKVSPFFDEGLNKYAEEKKESISRLLTEADESD